MQLRLQPSTERWGTLQVVALGLLASSTTLVAVAGGASSLSCSAFALLPGSAGSSWQEVPVQPSSLHSAAVSFRRPSPPAGWSVSPGGGGERERSAPAHHAC